MFFIPRENATICQGSGKNGVLGVSLSREKKSSLFWTQQKKGIIISTQNRERLNSFKKYIAKTVLYRDREIIKKEELEKSRKFRNS
jgi:hypothetical protein